MLTRGFSEHDLASTDAIQIGRRPRRYEAVDMEIGTVQGLRYRAKAVIAHPDAALHGPPTLPTQFLWGAFGPRAENS